jgi:hypothetical protein
MPRAKPRTASLLVATTACFAALALSACGAAVKPATGSRGVIDDPRTARADRVQCISQHHLPVQKVGLDELLIGAQPTGPRVVFLPTPGGPQAAQISGTRGQQGAEVIGSALLFTDQGSEQELGALETCLAQGVNG